MLVNVTANVTKSERPLLSHYTFQEMKAQLTQRG